MGDSKKAGRGERGEGRSVRARASAAEGTPARRSKPLPSPLSLKVPVDALTSVSGLLIAPQSPTAVLALAHGAGAGMAHPFLDAFARHLAALGVATLRYQFPYMELRKKRPDTPAVAAATVAAAAAAARAALPGVPVFAGGKSFGGRMTSTAQAEGLLGDVRGLVFLGFPLHPPGRPATGRADHLANVTVPMLFLQGTRDDFATLDLLRPVVKELGKRATLHLIEEGDHSFHVPKRTGRDDAAVLDELAATTAGWINDHR